MNELQKASTGRNTASGYFVPLIDAVRVLEAFGPHPIVTEDNAPVHNNEYCNRTRADLGIRRLCHPPLSRDLNPVENAWFELSGRLADMKLRYRKADNF